MAEAERFLPVSLLEKASLRGNEYAWPVSEIPAVIEAARQRGLVNIGGQLQFRFPEGTCECYWIEVDTYKELGHEEMTWPERVELSAAKGLSAFERISARQDLVDEGREAFSKAFADFEASGGKPADAMCFVWYIKAQSDD